MGCDRNAYHKQSIDGSKGRLLMERREKFGKILLKKMTATLHAYNCVLSPIRKLREDPIIFCHVIPRLIKFRRVCHFAEDLIERTHASDRLLSSQLSRIRNKEDHKDSKRNTFSLINLY